MIALTLVTVLLYIIKAGTNGGTIRTDKEGTAMGTAMATAFGYWIIASCGWCGTDSPSCLSLSNGRKRKEEKREKMASCSLLNSSYLLVVHPAWYTDGLWWWLRTQYCSVIADQLPLLFLTVLYYGLSFVFNTTISLVEMFSLTVGVSLFIRFAVPWPDCRRK